MLLSADTRQPPLNPTKFVALFIVFFVLIELLMAVGKASSTYFRFINPKNPRNSRNSRNSMNPIPFEPYR